MWSPLARAKKKKKKKKKKGGKARIPRYLRLGKYVLLALVVGAALLGRLSPMVLDPVTVVTRPLQELARPFFGADGVGRNVGAEFGRDYIRGVALLSLLPLIAVLALNAISRRTWCRTLCPLGGLLALFSKAPGIRRVVDVEACTRGARDAPATASSDAIERTKDFASSNAECTLCMRLRGRVPGRGDPPPPRGLPQPLAPGVRDPKRREALASRGRGRRLARRGDAAHQRRTGERDTPPAVDRRRRASRSSASAAAPATARASPARSGRACR